MFLLPNEALFRDGQVAALDGHKNKVEGNIIIKKHGRQKHDDMTLTGIFFFYRTASPNPKQS